MRILKLAHPGSGVDHPEYPFKSSFTTWITEELRDELLQWSAANQHRIHFHHPRAHTWNFLHQADRDAFTSHRPMQHSAQLLNSYYLDRSPEFPFEVSEVVSVDVRRDGRLCDEDRRIDWFWDDVEQWVIENCIGQVARAYALDTRTKTIKWETSMWMVHYGFERPDDAALFKTRWIAV